MYTVVVPDFIVPKCRNCGDMFFDSPATEQLTDALRERVGILKPDHIRAGRERLGLSREEFAAKLRIAPKTVADWEAGLILQPESMDLLMRLYFGLVEVRSALADEQSVRTLGQAAA